MFNAKRIDAIATRVIYAVAGFIVLLLGALLIYILASGLPHVTPHFLTSKSENFLAGGGIQDQLFNSFYLLFITLIISFPLSLGAGIYLSEYARKNFLTDVIRTAIEVLSSLPSVVVGLFGMLFFGFQLGFGYSVISGALALTFFNLPLLTRNVEESLKTVSNAQREAGIALGLTRIETVLRVILPEALPGIITGVILGAGRIFGEAAALIFTAGSNEWKLDFNDWNPLHSHSPLSIFRPAETVAVHIWKIRSEGTVQDGAQVAAAASAVLIIAVLLFNVLARILGKQLHAKLTSTKG
ncbi:MAG: phosphate ABC transporter permease PstA [Lactobacillales bacterium]|jgi:phosphate transport system permease protein|nr:phosphate ABC transporter permease PstA [Lactobacillales bacterium]